MWLRRASPLKLQHVRSTLELAGRPLLGLCLRFVRLYRPTFHRTSRHLYELADSLGIYPVIDHYHDPPVRPRPRDHAAERVRSVDLRVDSQLELLAQLKYQDELRSISVSPSGVFEPYYANAAFAPFDAQVLYSLVRHMRPQLLIEVGSGQSTRFAHQALRTNSAEGSDGRLIAVEPFEANYLEQLGIEVVRARVENLEPGFFSSLGPGDILFIDSSHVPSPGGDVTYLLLEIVPRLPPGVFVHIHDVFTPLDYPLEWSRRRWFWTEQYVVEALLVGNSSLEVILAVAYLARAHREALEAACPITRVGKPLEASSLWLRTRAPSSLDSSTNQVTAEGLTLRGSPTGRRSRASKA